MVFGVVNVFVVNVFVVNVFVVNVFVDLQMSLFSAGSGKVVLFELSRRLRDSDEEVV